MRPDRFQVISVLDPALDTENMTFAVLQEYIEKRDVKLVQHHVKTGARLAVFNIRAVPHALWQSYIDAAPDESVKVRRAFQCGVESVTNLTGNDGVAVDKWLPTGKATDGSTVATEQEVNDRFAPSEVLEIGSVIFRHSFLPLRTALIYRLPHTCVEPLAERSFLSAVPSQSTASTTTTEQPSGATLPVTETATG